MSDRQTAAVCRHCGGETTVEEARWVLGWGRLCPECEERATVLTAPSGMVRSVTIAPEPEDSEE